MPSDMMNSNGLSNLTPQTRKPYARQIHTQPRIPKDTTAPINKLAMDSTRGWWMMKTCGGYTIWFHLPPPQQLEFSPESCPSCCYLYTNGDGMYGPHQPIELMCRHSFCLSCVLTRVDKVMDPDLACRTCHPDITQGSAVPDCGN